MKPTVEQVLRVHFPFRDDEFTIASPMFLKALNSLIDTLYQEGYDDGGENMFIKLTWSRIDENHI